MQKLRPSTDQCRISVNLVQVDSVELWIPKHSYVQVGVREPVNSFLHI